MFAAKVLERVLIVIPTMLGVAIIVFFFMRLTPGDPVDIMMGEHAGISQSQTEALRKEFNLDQPLPTQLVLFLAGLARGDLGNSFTQRKPVSDLIAERLPATIELSFGALLFALAIGLPIGILSAVKQYSAADRLGMAGALVGISIPNFFLGIVLIIVFAVGFRILPVQGRIDNTLGQDLPTVTRFLIIDSILARNGAALWSALQHLVLPSIALGSALAAIIARILRSSLVEVLRSDYVTLARAKGQREYLVILKHAVRNALIPTVTVVGLQMGFFLGGNMVVELVFGWPGLGRLVVSSIFARDFPLIQGCVMVYAFIFVMVNLIVDILYTYLNPKIVF